MKPLYFILTYLFFNLPGSAMEVAEFKPHSAFIAVHNQAVIKARGDATVRRAPFSTFKIALALMGFDDGILESKDSPKWSFREEYTDNFQSWYTPEKGRQYNWLQDHTPATFMKYSVVWYSHQITQRLGLEKFENYIKKLNYGNQDVSGTPGQNDGLLNSWLGTSLTISPEEQVQMIEKLLTDKLDVSVQAQAKTHEVMDREEIWNGWKLYGKTGGGFNQDGWFVGWVEKNDQHISFAYYLDLKDADLKGIERQATVGLTAKELIKGELQEFLK